MVEKGKVIGVHYTGKLENGEVFDSSIGKEPLRFQVGSGQIINGFEDALIGKNIGDKVTTKIEAKDGYGEIREDLIIEVQKDQMPGEVEVGTVLEAQSSEGQSVNVVVKEIKENSVIIDGNHPLAGKSIIFDIHVVEIE